MKVLMGSDIDEQDEQWSALYEDLLQCLAQFGSEGVGQTDDCWVDDDNIGTTQQKIYVHNLALLQPYVVKSLQGLLRRFPRWEIMVAVAVPGPGDRWPDMGLTIRPEEIIDGLQREHFPPEFRAVRYEGSRPGTERD